MRNFKRQTSEQGGHPGNAGVSFLYGDVYVMTALGLLQVLLIVLKLMDGIGVSWLSVFVPLYLWLALVVVCIVIAVGNAKHSWKLPKQKHC